MEIYAGSLHASGNPNRWNSRGKFVIYTAANRSLACLENVVHRSSEGLNGLFKVMLIEIDETIEIKKIHLESLPKEWHKRASYPICQKIGDAWYQSGKSAVLEVPSSVMPREKVYILNTNHLDFKEKKIRLTGLEEFKFNPRIKSEFPEDLGLMNDE
ncbi:MAG: RES family NAD+ phosphorylase [Cyclobacteriaceae bacterium]